ncbi:MAG: hypothetical protein NXI10_07170 [bacterium]|nr:hypothetical protein [bacterium]
MEIFLEFLTYGAIGIAMVLIVLSYKLLAKEQERDDVRVPMLKSIKSYLTLALILAAFFGVTEIVSLIVSDNSGSDGLKTEVARLYKRNIKGGNAKSTEEQLAEIEDQIQNGVNESTKDSSQLEIEALKQELKRAEFGKYAHLVLQLRDSMLEASGDFINLKYHLELRDAGKEMNESYFEMIGQVLNYLDIIENDDLEKYDLIKDKWCDLKLDYSGGIIYNGNNKEWVVGSDIIQLLTLGHK